jgi:hypothetical protein
MMRSMTLFAVTAAIGSCAATSVPTGADFEPLAATLRVGPVGENTVPSHSDIPSPRTASLLDDRTEDPPWTDKVSAFTAAIVALFTAVLTWVGIQQWLLLRKSTALSIEALEAAKLSAEAATLAAEAAEKAAAVAERALIDIQRPYLFPQIDEFGWIDRADDYGPWVKVKLQNIGQQPAIIQVCRGEILFWPSGVPPKFDAVPLHSDIAVDPIVGPLILPIGATQDLMVNGPTIPMDLAERFRRNEVQAYARLLIRYRDPLGIVRASGQTWIYIRAEHHTKAQFRVQPYPESTYDHRIGEHEEDAWF